MSPSLAPWRQALDALGVHYRTGLSTNFSLRPSSSLTAPATPIPLTSGEIAERFPRLSYLTAQGVNVSARYFGGNLEIHFEKDGEERASIRQQILPQGGLGAIEFNLRFVDAHTLTALEVFLDIDPNHTGCGVVGHTLLGAVGLEGNPNVARRHNINYPDDADTITNNTTSTFTAVNDSSGASIISAGDIKDKEKEEGLCLTHLYLTIGPNACTPMLLALALGFDIPCSAPITDPEKAKFHEIFLGANLTIPADTEGAWEVTGIREHPNDLNRQIITLGKHQVRKDGVTEDRPDEVWEIVSDPGEIYAPGDKVVGVALSGTPRPVVGY